MRPQSSKRGKRACVIGLDGMPFSLLGKLAEDGTMPVMARLIAAGHLHRMKVTLPEISAVSWTSFMTGAGPGVHGIFGFIDLKPGSRELRFPNFRDVKADTLWDRLGAKGLKSVVLNQPSTYPARPIQGALVSGFVAIDLKKAVHPAGLLPILEALNYELDIDTLKARSDPDYLIAALNTSLDGRMAALNHLWEHEDWDYFQVVVTGTDRLQHYLWDAVDGEDHPYHGAAMDYYSRVDGFIGSIVDRFHDLQGGGGHEGLFLLSDHGFTGLERELNLNTWLEQEGYLRPGGGREPSLAGLHPETKAFAMDPNRIYFNRRDRFPDGSVDPEAVPRLASEVAERLEDLCFLDRPAIQRVIPRQEIYSGAHAADGPDLIALTHPGFDAKGALGREAVFSTTDLKGMHTWNDAFFWASGKAGDELEITGLASIIEKALLD